MADGNKNNTLDEFREVRELQNQKVMDLDHLGVKRFFNLDTNTYRDGALSSETKELLGLVASAVLRCNDCIDYHLDQCSNAGFTKNEIVDALNVALIVGGSIVIPHFRHAVDTLEQLEDALDGLVPRSSAGYAPFQNEGNGQKIVSMLGSRELRGNWLEADYCSTVNVLGSMVIDLTDTHVPPGLTTLNVFSLMGELTIIVPPDLRIENRITPLLAEVRQQRKLQTDPYSDRVVRITGFSLLSEVNLRNSR